MKIAKYIAIFLSIWIISICALAIGLARLENNNLDSNIINQISSLQDRVNKLEVEQKKVFQNVTQSLDKFQTRIWDVEDNIKLQNQFMQLQSDKWNDYYLKHWKKVEY